MVLGPEQVTWTTIFHNYLRSSVTNFRGSRTENMSCRSSVVQVIGGADHQGHRWFKSSVGQVTGVIGGASHRWCKSPGVIGGVCHRGNRWYRSPETSVVYYSSYYIHLFAIFYF